MQPVVLLIGRLPDVVGNVAHELDHLPIQWLGAHNTAEVTEQLEAEPRITCAIMGAALDDHVRGEMIGVIAAHRPDICIYVKDRSSGPAGFLPFVQRIVEHEVLAD